MQTNGNAVATVEPESWLLARIDHGLARMDAGRRQQTFLVAHDRYEQELAAGGEAPDLLDVFTAAVKDTAPEPERGTDIAG